MNTSKNVEANERLDEILITAIAKHTRTVFYHYTSEEGLNGILSSGGLRAMHRWGMNDSGEFSHAMNTLKSALARASASGVRETKRLILEIEESLDNIFSQDKNELDCRAYCACLSARRDDQDMWRNYADEGRGFAIGFEMEQTRRFVDARKSQKGYPDLFSGRVNYVALEEKCEVDSLLEEAARQYAAAHRSSARRDDIAEKCIVCLLLFLDFIKSEKWACEEEFRLIWILDKEYKVAADEIRRIEKSDKSYLFVDLTSPITNRLTLHEILIGPSADLSVLHDALDENGYGSGGLCDRPRIEFSSATSKLRRFA